MAPDLQSLYQLKSLQDDVRDEPEDMFRYIDSEEELRVEYCDRFREYLLAYA